MENNIFIINKDLKLIKNDLNYSSSLLDIHKFIEISKFDIDPFLIDKFWFNLNNNTPIFINKDILNWMGYEGKFAIKNIFYKTFR